MMPVSQSSDSAFCIQALPGVSRTFGLTIRLLPPKLEYAVLIGYLLCRIADTIEDSVRLSIDDKLRLLELFRGYLDDADFGTSAVRNTFENGSGADELLAREADTVLREFHRLPKAERYAIKPWVQEMCNGMAYYVLRRRPERSEGAGMFSTVEELERYCYYVAGTVGHMLTELFLLHDGNVTAKRHERMNRLATSFGLGLQLTNIVKDVVDDHKRGVTFIPDELLHLRPGRPGSLAELPVSELQTAVGHLVERAWGHLEDALEYCVCVPRRQYRVRVFCLTSLYFAARTLRLTEGDSGLLGGERKLKISRRTVYRTLAITCALAPVNSFVRTYFECLAGTRMQKPGG